MEMFPNFSYFTYFFLILHGKDLERKQSPVWGEKQNLLPEYLRVPDKGFPHPFKEIDLGAELFVSRLFAVNEMDHLRDVAPPGVGFRSRFISVLVI